MTENGKEMAICQARKKYIVKAIERMMQIKSILRSHLVSSTYKFHLKYDFLQNHIQRASDFDI
jgi:hypothetical protein